MKIQVPKKCPECGSDEMEIRMLGCRGSTYVNGKKVFGKGYFVKVQTDLLCGKCNYENKKVL